MAHGILFVQSRSELPSVQLVKETLRKSETLRVLEAANATEATGHIGQDFSGLLVLTIDGKEQLAGAITLLTAQSRAIKTDRTIRPLVFNSLDNPKVIKTLTSLGCAEFIESSVTPKALLLKIQRHLKQVRTRAATQADENRRIAGSKAKEGEESLGGSSKSEQKLVDALFLASDYWTFRTPPDAKRIMGRWLVEMTGPGPSVGEWVQIASKEKIRGVSTFEWKMRAADSPFATPDGAWILVARQIDFIWKINRWRLVGGYVSLTFRKGDQVLGKRFVSESNEVITIAKNSSQALARQAEIEATFSGGARAAGAEGEKEESGGELSLKAEEEKAAGGKDFLDKRARKDGKELSIEVEKPDEGKELSLELDPEKEGKELSITLDKAREGKDLSAKLDPAAATKEMQLTLDEEEEGGIDLSGMKRENIFNHGRGVTQGTKSDKVTYEDEEGDGPISAGGKKPKRKRGAFGQSDDEAEGTDGAEGELELGEEAAGSGPLGQKKKKKKDGSPDQAGDALALSDEMEADAPDAEDASSQPGAPKKLRPPGADAPSSQELSLELDEAEGDLEDLPAVGRQNVFNSGRGVTQGANGGKVTSLDDFRTGVDAFKPVGVRSMLGTYEAKVLDGEGGALSVSINGALQPKTQHVFEVQTENLKPAVSFSTKCLVVAFTPSEGAPGGIAQIQLPAAGVAEWEKVQDAVADRQLEIVRFMRMAKGT